MLNSKPGQAHNLLSILSFITAFVFSTIILPTLLNSQKGEVAGWADRFGQSIFRKEKAFRNLVILRSGYAVLGWPLGQSLEGFPIRHGWHLYMHHQLYLPNSCCCGGHSFTPSLPPLFPTSDCASVGLCIDARAHRRSAGQRRAG